MALLAPDKLLKREQALRRQIDELQLRLAEAVEAIRAIRNGEVDAVIVPGAKGQQVFSQAGADSVYRLIIETMQEAAFTVDFDGHILFCNAQFGQLVRRPLEQIVGCSLLDVVAARDRASASSLMTAARQHPVRHRLLMEAADGTAVPAYMSANVLNLPDAPSICVVAADLTELEGATELIQQLRLQQEALHRKDVELARSNEELTQFATIASHDLQEPLRMVTGFLELLRDKYQGQLDDKAREYIGYSVDGATRMSALIKDLLAYARVSSTGMESGPVDLTAVANDVVATLAATINEAEAAIAVDPMPPVRGDAGQLGQLLQNLVANAIKFRVEGRRPEVRIGAKQDAGEWTFFVADNGIGIEPAQYERIFMVFQRLHTREEYPGTGVGLAICKKIVERHGGRIWVESKPGEGSTFFFTLPGVSGNG